MGLDIGATGLRAALLRRRHGSWTLMRAASVSLPPGVVRNGAARDDEALLRAIRQLWRRGRFRTRKVVFGISDPGLIARQVELPWMPPPDFAAALPYQLDGVLPVDAKTIEVGYHVLDEVLASDAHGQPTTMNQILLVAASSAGVLRTATLLRRARLEPVAADSSALALVRAACAGVVPPGDDLEMLVDVGADLVTVMLHRAGRPLFMRAVPGAGSAAATEAIATRLGIGTDEADALKIAMGLHSAAHAGPASVSTGVFAGLPLAPDSPVDTVHAAAVAANAEWATRVISEIRNSLDYYASTHADERVDRVVLSGRGADLDGLMARIVTELRIPAERLDVCELIDIKGAAAWDGAEADMSIATGLGMAA